MRLLLIEIVLLNKNGQFTMIKVVRSPGTKQIKADITDQKGDVVNTLSSTIAPIPISLKGDSQGSIALAHNLVFYICTKYIVI